MNLHPYGLRRSCSHTVDERGQGDCDIFGAIRIGELRISGLKHDVVPTCVHPLEGGRIRSRRRLPTSPRDTSWPAWLPSGARGSFEEALIGGVEEAGQSSRQAQVCSYPLTFLLFEGIN